MINAPLDKAVDRGKRLLNHTFYVTVFDRMVNISVGVKRIIFLIVNGKISLTPALFADKAVDGQRVGQPGDLSKVIV